MAAASGIQALLYLNSFGIDGRTDGFFVAFALYTIFGVFSQSIRVTSAPLLVGERPRLLPREYGACLALIAIPVAAPDDPARRPQFAHLLAPGLDAGRSRGHRVDALPIARPGDDPAALGRRRGDPARRTRPFQRDRRRLHRRRRARAWSPTSSSRRSPTSSRWAGRCWRWRPSPCATMLVGLRGSRPERHGGAAVLARRPGWLSMRGLILGRTGDLPRLQRALRDHPGLRQRLRRRATRPSSPTPTSSPATWSPAPPSRSACRGSPTCAAARSATGAS